MVDNVEAVVIGSGFGGGIAACRLAKRWPGKVLVLERGKRYPMGSFPRTPHDMARNFWNLPEEDKPRPRKIQGEEEHGLFDIRNYRHMDVVLAAGLGGGSLIYANVFMEPPEHVFDDRWPAGISLASLQPYYRVVKQVLGSRPIPRDGNPRRQIVRTELFEEVARQLGRKSELCDINVFFGRDFAKPLDIGLQQENAYGAPQTSCLYCGECDVGCNTHSKNTTDLNYLFVAERRYGATVLTEHQAEGIVPLDAAGRDDPAADGTHGYRVRYLDLREKRREPREVIAQRVVIAAGTLGSTELLLRAKQRARSLPRVSDRLGHRFSGNGDFLSFVMGAKPPANPNYGPVITQRIDFNLFQGFDPQRAFILEDASYPAFAAWFVEGVKPRHMHFTAIERAIKNAVGRWLTGTSPGSVGYALADLLSGDVSYNTAVLLCMGIDRSNGVMSLDGDSVSIDWPSKDSRSLYEAILAAGKKFKEIVAAKDFFPLPTWFEPLRKNISVHPLGGCVLAADPSQGVTSADPATFGQVFGYRGLYVMDGAIVPTAVGANPTATLSALAEMAAQGITGIAPDAAL